MESFSQLDINGFKTFDSVTPIEHDEIEEQTPSEAHSRLPTIETYFSSHESCKSDPIPKDFGFIKSSPPDLHCQYPPPGTGKDDRLKQAKRELG